MARYNVTVPPTREQGSYKTILAVCLSLFVLAYVQARELPTDCPGCMTASEIAAEAEDFTDTGVNCIDDCLALEPFTDPETVPDEYMLEPDEYTAWDDYLTFKEQQDKHR